MSSHSPFTEMQKAVDIVNGSPHPTNKIAATLYGRDKTGLSYSISRTNYWPAPIENHFGTGARLGNSSSTLHAETACILEAPLTEGASICITDPFCPNCAKNIAEAGIKTIYIDHKGFNKDFAARRHHHFQAMSMRICEKAGINVYEIWRKEHKLVPILEHAADYQPAEENPVEVRALGDLGEGRAIQDYLVKRVEEIRSDPARAGHKIALALAKDGNGQVYSLYATAHLAVGYRTGLDEAEVNATEGKYSFILEPVNRVLMNAPRHGLKVLPDGLFVSQIPTAREQVNLVGAGVTSLYVQDRGEARDREALDAMATLEGAGILVFRAL